MSSSGLFDVAESGARRLSSMFDLPMGPRLTSGMEGGGQPRLTSGLEGGGQPRLTSAPGDGGQAPLRYTSLLSDDNAGRFNGWDLVAQRRFDVQQAARQAASSAGHAAGQAAAAASGGGWTGPATAADNAGITGQQVDQVIAATRANSPMIGKGQLILDYANARNVSVPEMLGIFLAESELGTTAGPGWNIAGVGGPGNFSGYGSLDDAIRGAIDNLGSDLYAGKSLQEHIGYWFAGPERWAQSGLDASDGANGTVRDYITGKVAPMYQAFGVALQQAQAPTRSAPASGTGFFGGGMASIWGGQDAPITQEFEAVTPGIDQGIYAYGDQYGVHGHTGLDIGLKRGTQLYLPAGMSGVVVERAPGYFRDEDYGDDGQSYARGELRIRLDNGWELILGHTSQINVRPGDRVTAGQLVALSGSANGDHLHLELRIPDQSTGSGWRIVDPREYLH